MRLSEEKNTGSRHARGSSVKIMLGMALAAALLAGCNSPQTTSAGSTSDFGDSDYVEVCQDPETGDRVSDDKCEQSDRDREGSSSGSNSGFFWYLYSMHLLNQNRSTIPGIGQKLTGGYDRSQYSQVPNTGSYYRGVPSTGGQFGKKSVKSAPVFDNSKMLPVPGDFQPPTAPAATKAATTPAPAVTAQAPAPVATTKSTPAPAATVPATKSTPAPAYKVPAYKAPAYKAPAYKAPTYKK